MEAALGAKPKDPIPFGFLAPERTVNRALPRV
jgi:hypothetical protein